MLFYTLGQSDVFLAAMLAGVAAGLWYDALELAARLMRAGKIMRWGLDLAFALGAFSLLTYCLYRANYAQLRPYALAGAACGFALYSYTAGRALKALFRVAARAARAIASRAAGTKFIKRISR